MLVKQDPDVRSRPVGVRPDGTIDRKGASAIVNPADLHAVEAALQLADEVIAVSMGPAQADTALREVISLGADRGILLCDRILAGSDTWATANALATAIDRIGAVDAVFCGMSSLDGETGQVGPSVAQRLGWPQATGCESITRQSDEIVVRRIVEGGFERVRLPLPAVVTVAETGFLPRYPTIAGRRCARTATIERLSAADMGLDESRVGLAASPTKVAHMEPMALPDRTCRFIGADGFGYEDLAEALVDLGAVEATSSLRTLDEPPASTPPAAAEPGPPSVWVVTESHDGHLLPVSRELLSKATELAPRLGGGFAAISLTGAPGHEAEEAAKFGADVALIAQHYELAPYRTEPHARVLADLASRADPRRSCSAPPPPAGIWRRGWPPCSTPGWPQIAPISRSTRGNAAAWCMTRSCTRCARRWAAVSSLPVSARRRGRRWRPSDRGSSARMRIRSRPGSTDFAGSVRMARCRSQELCGADTAISPECD